MITHTQKSSVSENSALPGLLGTASTLLGLSLFACASGCLAPSVSGDLDEVMEVDVVTFAPDERPTPVAQVPAVVEDESVSPTSRARARGDRLQGGDLIQVTVFEEPELSGAFPISSKGTVDYPLLGQVPLGNLTLSDAARLLHRMLGDGYLKDPLVNVSRTPGVTSGVHILGAVSAPGTYEPEIPGARMTLALLLRDSGGLIEQASTLGVMLIRQTPAGMVAYPVHPTSLRPNKPLSETIELQLGDIITVPWKTETPSTP